MIKKYGEWLKESLQERGQRVAEAFIKNLKEPLFKLEGGKFEDWWRISGRDYDEADMAYLDSLERIERAKPEVHRLTGEVYMMEFKHFTGANSHGYALASFDTRNFKLHINPSITGNFRKEIQEIFDKTLEKEFPEEHKGKKYGI
jgi:hypothetical protein